MNTSSGSETYDYVVVGGGHNGLSAGRTHERQ
jgi:phytoene dehydrogenase-like protein